MTSPIGTTANLSHRATSSLPGFDPAVEPSPAAVAPPAPRHYTGRSHYEAGDGAGDAPSVVPSPAGMPYHPTTDPHPGVIPVSAAAPSIRLPTEFEIRDTSEAGLIEISVEAGQRVLGKLTGGSDALVYANPEGKVEALAERIPSRMGRGKDFLVRDEQGGLIGTLRSSWNNRYAVLDANGNEVARVMPKVGRNNYVVRAKGRDVALISHPAVREVGGQWKVSQEPAHKIDPRLMVVLPAITLVKNREIIAARNAQQLEASADPAASVQA